MGLNEIKLNWLHYRNKKCSNTNSVGHVIPKWINHCVAFCATSTLQRSNHTHNTIQLAISKRLRAEKAMIESNDHTEWKKTLLYNKTVTPRRRRRRKNTQNKTKHGNEKEWNDQKYEIYKNIYAQTNEKIKIYEMYTNPHQNDIIVKNYNFNYVCFNWEGKSFVVVNEICIYFQKIV